MYGVQQGGALDFPLAVYEFFSSCSLPICVQTLENSKAADNDDEINGGGGGVPHIIDDLKRNRCKAVRGKVSSKS